MCVPDAQHKDDVKMPTTKCTGAKQSTLFTFFKLPSSSVKPGAKRKVYHSPEKIVKKTEKKLVLMMEKKSPKRNPSQTKSFYVSGRNILTG